MKLGLVIGYWPSSGPPPDAAEQIAAAEDLGFDSIWTSEAYGSDCFTPLAWWGAATRRVKLGTAITQISARSPASTAMTALTLDHLSGGRVILGLGVSGPQVVEGWYGQPFAKPLARTREYIDIIRKVLAREGPVTSEGEHHPLPRPGEDGHRGAPRQPGPPRRLAPEDPFAGIRRALRPLLGQDLRHAWHGHDRETGRHRRQGQHPAGGRGFGGRI